MLHTCTSKAVCSCTVIPALLVFVFSCSASPQSLHFFLLPLSLAHPEIYSKAVVQAGLIKLALIHLVWLLESVKSHWAQLFCCSCVLLSDSGVDWAIWVWSSSPVCFEQPAASHRTRNFTSFLHQILSKTPYCAKPPVVALQAEAGNFMLGP